MRYRIGFVIETKDIEDMAPMLEAAVQCEEELKAFLEANCVESFRLDGDGTSVEEEKETS